MENSPTFSLHLCDCFSHYCHPHCLPTGYEDALLYQGTIRAVGEVLEVNNDTVKSSGLIQSGEQMCTLLIEDGPLKGREIEGVNF